MSRKILILLAILHMAPALAQSDGGGDGADNANVTGTSDGAAGGAGDAVTPAPAATTTTKTTKKTAGATKLTPAQVSQLARSTGDLTMQPKEWAKWIRYASKLPRTWSFRVETTTQRIVPCDHMVAGAACYNSGFLSKPTTGGPLDQLSVQARLNWLKYNVLLYGLAVNVSKLNWPKLNDPLDLAKIKQNLVNAIAARVRYKMYRELDHIQAKMKNAAKPTASPYATANTKIGASATLGLRAVERRSIQQLKLLDFIFPDACVWEELLHQQSRL